jgi:hypothetical protein
MGNGETGEEREVDRQVRPGGVGRMAEACDQRREDREDPEDTECAIRTGGKGDRRGGSRQA